MSWLNDDEIIDMINTDQRIKKYGESKLTRKKYLEKKINEQNLTNYLSFENDFLTKKQTFESHLLYYLVERYIATKEEIPSKFTFSQIINQDIEIIKRKWYEKYTTITSSIEEEPKTPVKSESNERKQILSERKRHALELIEEETGQKLKQDNKIIGDRYIWFLSDRQLEKFNSQQIKNTINEIYDIQGLNNYNEKNEEQIFVDYLELRDIYIANQENIICDLTVTNDLIEYIRQIQNEQNETNEQNEPNENILRIQIDNENYIDIDMNTINFEEFAEILKNAVRDGMRESTQQEPINENEHINEEEQINEEEEFKNQIAETLRLNAVATVDIARGVSNLRNTPNTLNYYMNPYKNMDKEQIIQELNKTGLMYVDSQTKDTKEEVLNKLEIVKMLENQSKAMIEIKMNRQPYIENGFERIGFDTFEKIGQLAKNGTPLEKVFKFIQGIEPIHIKFDTKSGNYIGTQGNEKYTARDFKTINKWSLLGGFKSKELKIVREARRKQEDREKEIFVIAKARKL